MKKLTTIISLSTIFVFGFLLMSTGLVAQNAIPNSDDIEFQVDSKTDYVPSFEESNPPIMSVDATAALMDLPPHDRSYTGNTRGYWFTAPSDFTISGLRVPEDASTADQHIEIIRFNSGAPPIFSGTTNDFVSLGRWIGVAGSSVIACNIAVSTGDVIGILGVRGNTNSYSTDGPHNSTINGNPVVLTRMGMQYQLAGTPAQNVWQEPGSPISRVELYYDGVQPVPVSNWAIIFGVLLIGAFIVVRYRTKLA